MFIISICTGWVFELYVCASSISHYLTQDGDDTTQDQATEDTTFVITLSKDLLVLPNSMYANLVLTYEVVYC